MENPSLRATRRDESTFRAPQDGLRDVLGVKGMLAYGMGFGLLMAGMRASHRVCLRAETKPAVVEKYDLSKTYLATLPRSIMDETSLNHLLSTVPKEKWNSPPADSYLLTLKKFAETYGEGKATKMSWWDFWYMRVNSPAEGDIDTGPELKELQDQYLYNCRTGTLPLYIPGPAQVFPSGVTVKWRGDEPFAGDAVQSAVTDSKFAKDFLKAFAYNRDGLKPWQRGLEIGMAHGYWLIGPFVALSQLRNTPEAATVGLLSGVVCIGVVTAGGLLAGKTVVPTLFDKEGDYPGKGFNEVIQAHGIGGIIGAAGAHVLISVFGN